MGLGDVIEAFIALASGIWLLLVMYGRVRPPSPEFADWLARHRRSMTIVGAVTVASSAAMIVLTLLGVPG